MAPAVNLQDKMETMKSNLNEKVTNLTEEVQKLNISFEILKFDFSATSNENNSVNEIFALEMIIEVIIALERRCWANVQYSRWDCLENTGIPSSANDSDLEEVVCKAITTAGVDITADDIEDCHRVGRPNDNQIW